MKPGDEFESALFGFVEGRHGKFLTLKRDVYVSRSIERYGEWCEGEIDLLAQVIEPGDVVVDAGANIGTHTLAFAKMVGGGGRVYAFEPQPMVFRALAANIALNDALTAYPLGVALGAEAGTIAFAEIDYEKDGNFGGLTLDAAARLAASRPETPQILTPVMRLDDALSLPRLKLIKADIEGMEPDLLDGAAETLKRHQPYLYLECENPEDAPPLFDALERRGYEGYWHVCAMRNPNNWRGEAEDVFGAKACVNLFCAPKGRAVEGLPKAKRDEPHPRGEPGS